MAASTPPCKPAQTCIGAVLSTKSDFRTVVAALPTILRRTSPIPIGRTPLGLFSSGISLPAVNASM